MVDLKLKEWDESYTRMENHILYPKEEVVRFLNRFVRKKNGYDNNFADVSYVELEQLNGRVRGLDFGCGIGRQTVLLEEFGIEAYGIDLSNEAIKTAKMVSKHFKYPDIADRLLVSSSEDLPYDNNMFSVCIADSCIDSMPFTVAKHIVKELSRVTRGFSYFSFISREFDPDVSRHQSEEEVSSEHEKGTIQTYYTEDKIGELFYETSYKVVSNSLVTQTNSVTKKRSFRYHVVVKNF